MFCRRLLFVAIAIGSLSMTPLSAHASVTWNDGLYVCRPVVEGPRGFHVRFESNDDDVTYATVLEDDNSAHEVVKLNNDAGWEWGTASYVKYYVFSGQDAQLQVETKNSFGTVRDFACEVSEG